MRQTTKHIHATLRPKARVSKRPRGRRGVLRTRGVIAPDALSQSLTNGTFAALVRYFTVRPDDAPHVRGLMRDLSLGAASLNREVGRMEQLGLVTRDRTSGPMVRVQAVGRHAAWAPLRALVRAYAKPVELLRVTLIGVPHVAGAFIFGSVARGQADADSDCDVFVVTTPGCSEDDRRAVVQALAVQTANTSLALGREVSFVVYRPEEMQRHLQSGPQFVARVLEAPKQWILGALPTTSPTLVVDPHDVVRA